MALIMYGKLIRVNRKLLGEKIRAVRKASNLSQETLCSASKIALTALKNLESGDGNPTLGTIEAIESALNVEFLRVDPAVNKVTQELKESAVFELRRIRDLFSQTIDQLSEISETSGKDVLVKTRSTSSSKNSDESETLSRLKSAIEPMVFETLVSGKLKITEDKAQTILNIDKIAHKNIWSYMVWFTALHSKQLKAQTESLMPAAIDRAFHDSLFANVGPDVKRPSRSKHPKKKGRSQA